MYIILVLHFSRDMSPSPTENDALLKCSNLPTSERSNMEEYGSLALAVVEDSVTHEPVVLHDLTGPVMLMDDPELLERRDSLYSVVSHTTKVSELQPENDPSGQATISSEVAIMTKNLIGCGSLSLCNGIALCANAPNAIWAGNFWILILGVIFGYFCWLIAKVCDITGRTTYRGIWQETVGSRGSMAVSIVNGLKAGLANLAYTCILADTTLSLFLSAGYNVPRGLCLLIVTFCFILPLCLLKNLHVLAPFSVLGTAGIVFTAAAMLVRYRDGSYKPGGKYFDDIDLSLQPMFGTVNNAWSADILPFVCMAYEAYVMHYNAARFYTELKDRSLPRFGVAVSLSFGLTALLYVAIASIGYLTFGGNCSGYILNNYSPHDPLASISRVAVGLSVLLTYPIVFFGVRDSVLDVCETKVADQLAHNHGYLTLGLLTILTFGALFVTDLGLINAVGGGLVTTPIVFLFPSIMYRGCMKFLSFDELNRQQNEVTLATGLTVVGTMFGLAGAWIAINDVLNLGVN